MAEIVRDLRFALRSAMEKPSFTAMVLLTLAIGIGPTTAIFSLVQSLFLRELPYRDADSLVIVWRQRNEGDRAPVSGPDYDDFRRMNSSFSETAISTWTASFNIGDVQQPVRVEGALVSPNFFRLLGTSPILGVPPPESDVDSVQSAVISHSLWQQNFGGQRNVIGHSVRLNGKTYRVAAVMPKHFAFPEKAQLWIPFRLTTDALGHRAFHQYRFIARLKPGVNREEADAEMKRIARRLGEMYPETTRGIDAFVESFREATVGNLKRPLLVLLGGVLCLLLIACSNVANLMLVRAASRQHEMAIRTALGASRGRLLRQLGTESLLFAVTGGALGLLLAVLALRLVRTLGSTYFVRPELIHVDGTVLAFNFGIAVVTGVIFGLAPLLASGQTYASLQSGARSRARHGWEARAVREGIVVAVVALSFLLLIGSALLIHSFWRLRNVPIGMRTDNILTLKVFLPETKYPEVGDRRRFSEQFLARLRAAEGIEGAAVVNGIPTENTMSGDLSLPDAPDPVSARRIASFTEVSPGFFATAGVPILAGRDFSDDDVRNVAALLESAEQGTQNFPPPPLIVNATLARRFFGTRSAVGQRIMVGGDFPGVIIGVVGDVKQSKLTEPAPPHVYMPMGTPLPFRLINFMVRSSVPRAGTIDIVRRELHQLDPDVPPYLIRTMDEVIDTGTSGPRFQAVVITIFAAIALILATIGIYGVISYTVAQRTREMGIRMAAGAGKADLMQLVVGRVVRLAALGIGIGATAALVATRWLESLLFEVSAVEPRAFVAVGVLLMITAIVASATPAVRAASTDPMTSLRYE
jgi:putative ABC transport system permease protein